MSDRPTGPARIILPEGLTWEQVRLAVEIIQNWEIAGSSDAVEEQMFSAPQQRTS